MTLVSCIMPTCNRHPFVPAAIEYFLGQDYPNAELVIVDDGSDPIADLIPDTRRIRYVRLPARASVGAKRNIACQYARGEIIAHWDDDDWHAPHRLRYQVDTLRRAGADVCGIRTLLFFDIDAGRAWRYACQPNLPLWLSGSTLCYTRAFWAANRFEDINVSEDAQFVRRCRPERLLPLPQFDFHVGIIHAHNVSRKNTAGSCWTALPTDAIRRVLGADWDRYQKEPQPVTPAPRTVPNHERSVPSMTVAKKDDLSLIEFAAFNHGQSLPWMRRWELPFTLFQSRLESTTSVLDCTINPVNFRERLSALYPHVLYRHWNPIQHGQFALPFGVPDHGFDQVICVNSLEHLLQPQREALVAALARKLKPGGRFLVTSDYYFDSAWQQPAFLNAGVMRSDRAEVFNGWNKVTFAEYLDLMARHDLHPLGEPVTDPREDDQSAYRNPNPYPHACIAGVFARPAAPEPRCLKVLFALLTWNTRDISVDSIRAYVREAHMLRRLGHDAEVCVCDNGSTDGTAQALQSLESEIDIPHRFIYNPENRGNSSARNQIIDYMLAGHADYVLFMDGDIEIVPFSSFAMLRHMENSGSRLGCIGADSSGQTPLREQASPCFYSIDSSKLETTNLVAWTQYGLFRREVFEDGVRFDHREPFDRAGWGFEDNDLAFQMDMKGYLNQRFYGMVYLHRAARSSMRIMREQGIDPVPLYARRKQYVIEKWSTVPHINDGPLALVRRVNMF